MTSLSDTVSDLRADALVAASQAAGLVPSSVPLSPGDLVEAAEVVASLPPGALAVVADVVGAASGSVVVVAENALGDALASSPMGPLPLTEALRPALDALAAAFGTAVVADVREVPADLALRELAARGAHAVVPLRGEGGASAWVGLSRTSVAAASVPAPRTPAVNGSAGGRGLDMLHDVVMELTAELGRARMTVRDLLGLQPGTVVELDRLAGSPADLLVNGRLIARGEVVVVDEDYALKITELLSGADHD
ncbi:MAG TPA: flagellar motor switch protein FliN [Actinomycetales bacterium]|nr:flagellar motor switch protein FliN [Actinomycetales bacterium]